MELAEAYERAKTAGGAVPRPDRGLVRLDGPQRIWFLQNTVTNDVEDVEVGRWVESCFLTAKGKVVAHFRVGIDDDAVWLDVDPPATDDLVEWFTRYRFRTKVEITDVSGSCVTLIGPRARDIVADGAVVREGDTVAFGDTLGGVPIAEVHGPGVPEDVPVVPAEVYDILRMEAGVGRFGVDYGPTDLAQEAGLTRLLSVDKGCYIGQEVVARLHFRGHVNKVLRPLTLEGIEPEDAVGAELQVDGKRVGTITSAVRSPERGVIGIGMVRVEPDDGARADVDGGTATIGPIPEGTKVAS